MDPIHAYEKVKTSAAGRTKPEPRTIDAMTPGEAVRQGDLYLISLRAIPKGSRPIVDPPAQLVPGRSRGSRHAITAETFGACTLYSRPSATEFDGPVIEARAAFEVSHPEHGHFILPAGIYSVRYQRRFAAHVKRVRD